MAPAAQPGISCRFGEDESPPPLRTPPEQFQRPPPAPPEHPGRSLRSPMEDANFPPHHANSTDNDSPAAMSDCSGCPAPTASSDASAFHKKTRHPTRKNSHPGSPPPATVQP